MTSRVRAEVVRDLTCPVDNLTNPVRDLTFRLPIASEIVRDLTKEVDDWVSEVA